MVIPSLFESGLEEAQNVTEIQYMLLIIVQQWALRCIIITVRQFLMCRYTTKTLRAAHYCAMVGIDNVFHFLLSVPLGFLSPYVFNILSAYWIGSYFLVLKCLIIYTLK